jgi:myo-inositol-1(or 4)-monophosphatase
MRGILGPVPLLFLKTMHPLVNIAVSAARAAGNFIMRNQERVEQLKVERKSRNDFVTHVDRGAEQEIVSQIHKMYPDHGILGEEGGASGKDNAEVTWIIDPLDGTTNFLHRLPHFAVSIGVQVKGRLEHGVIYAPSTQDLYIASRGAGATLNGRRIRVSQTKELDQSLIGTGVPLQSEYMDRYVPMLRSMVELTSGVRRAGAASLDLAYVAAGRLDGYWEMNLKPWDIAAGIVLVQEAGGMVSELYGADDVLKTGNILAANTKLHGLLKTTLQ